MKRPEIVVIGGSTGGARALGTVLTNLPAAFPIPAATPLLERFRETIARSTGS